ncbi:MAG: 50S ribosomal protein L29 [Patescibacteria group bacterium]|nr:50S ribosomal protein L29 [Patescibacteria group bacterium]
MKALEYREMTIDELEDHLKEKRTELVTQRFEVGSRQLKNYNKVGETRREIARILTVMKQMQSGSKESVEKKEEDKSKDTK